MGTGSAILLAPVLLEMTKRSEKRMEDRAKITDELVGGLSSDVEEAEASVEQVRSQLEQMQDRFFANLQSARDDERQLLQPLVEDLTYDGIRSALEAATRLELLAPIGVRGDVGASGFYLRLRLRPSSIVLLLDPWGGALTRHEAEWSDGQELDDVLRSLISGVANVPDIAWDWMSAFESVLSALEAGLTARIDGDQVRHVVQESAGGWLITDYAIVHKQRPYAVAFDRIDEQDWYEHLKGKNWTENDEVGVLLDQAREIKDLVRALDAEGS